MVFQVKINRLGYLHGPPPEMGFFSSMVLISRSYQNFCRNSDKPLGWQASFHAEKLILFASSISSMCRCYFSSVVASVLPSFFAKGKLFKWSETFWV